MEEIKKTADKEYRYGNFSVAENLYKQCLEIEPSNPVLFSNIAMCQFKQEDFENCIENADRANSLRPDWSKPLFWKGSALLCLGNAPLAVTMLEQAQSFEPANEAIKRRLKLARRKAKGTVTAIFVPVEGDPREIEVDSSTGDIQKWITGSTDELTDGASLSWFEPEFKITMFVDSQGQKKKLPINGLASFVYQGHDVHGPALFMNESLEECEDGDMDYLTVDFPVQQFKRLFELAKVDRVTSYKKEAEERMNKFMGQLNK